VDLHVSIDRSAGDLAGQIASALRAAARSGRLPPGALLPASRELAADLRVSRGRVVEAYEQLTAEGFLVSRQGSGTRVADVAHGSAQSRPDLGARRHDHALGPGRSRPPRYNLIPGTPDLALFPRREWLAAVRHALGTVSHDELGYADPGGVPALRAELAGYLGRVRAAYASPDNVTVVSGVSQGLSLSVRALVATGRDVLAIEEPAGDRIRPSLRAAGARLVPIPVDADGIEVAALRSSEARAVLLTPAHQYPTGVVLSAPRRAELIDWAAGADAIVLEDDYDAEFRYDRDPVGCLQGLSAQRAVLVGSVSKSLAPGLRLGWVVAPGWLTASVREARARSDFGSPVLDQFAFARLIGSGGYDRHLRLARRHYRARRDALVAALARWLPEARIHGVSAGVHLMVELPTGSDEPAVVAAAAELGLAVAPLAPMRLAAGGPPGLVLGYARLPEHRLVEAARLLAKAVAAVRGTVTSPG